LFILVVVVTWIHFSYSVRWAQENSAASSQLKILDSISRKSVVHCAITSIKWATKSYVQDCELTLRVTDHELRVIVNCLYDQVITTWNCESWSLRRELSNWLYDHQAERARWALIYVWESWSLRRELSSSLHGHLAGRARWALIYVFESWPLRRELSTSLHGHMVI